MYIPTFLKLAPALWQSVLNVSVSVHVLTVDISRLFESFGERQRKGDAIICARHLFGVSQQRHTLWFG